MNRSRLLLLLLALVMLMAACGDSSSVDGSDPEALSVVVTTSIWGDIVSNVTGDAADVEVLFPLGADAHDYQLSSAQVAALQRADLVVVNGLRLEEGILDVIESVEADGANVLAVAPMLDPITFGATHHSDHDEDGDHDEEALVSGQCDLDADHDDQNDEGHAHEEGGCDPHVWMDPLRVAVAVERIAEALEALDSTVDWMANAEQYADELRALDHEIVAMLDAVPADRRKLVTNHEALGYFAERYGFEVVGVVIPGGSTLADPSSAELAELVEVMKDERINVIFGETVEPLALAEAVADEVGVDVRVVELFTGSLGGPGSDGESYLDMIGTNATRVAEALS